MPLFLSLLSISVVVALDDLALLGTSSLAVVVTDKFGDAFLAGAGLVLGEDPSILQPRAHPRRLFGGLGSSCRRLSWPKGAAPSYVADKLASSLLQPPGRCATKEALLLLQRGVSQLHRPKWPSPRRWRGWPCVEAARWRGT